MRRTLRPVVRDLIAELGWELAEAAELSGIPYGTLKNNTRENDPQPIRRTRAFALLRVLNEHRPAGRDPLTIRDICATSPDDTPGEPPQKTHETETNTGPGREDGKTGPKRLTERGAA